MQSKDRSPNSEESKNRLFFALHVDAPWPSKLPNGRLLNSNERHITLAFLGDIELSSLLPHLTDFPKPPFQLSPTGILDEVIFLPQHQHRVVAWHASFDQNQRPISEYQHLLSIWLKDRGFPPTGEHRVWLPHVTMARAPFDEAKWKEQFQPLPFVCHHIYLYESIGNLRYEPRWSHNLLQPFEEFAHTADIAYKIRGKNLEDILSHAALALTFRHSEIAAFVDQTKKPKNLQDVVHILNQAIAYADAKWGCPLKSVSYHGEITTGPDQFLEWEMIVDV